jgi:lipoprotein NlpI
VSFILTLFQKWGCNIVDTIIGDISFSNDEQLFNDSDNDNDIVVAEVIVKKATKKSKEKVNAMKLFVKQSDKSMYKVTIKNVAHFE